MNEAALDLLGRYEGAFNANDAEAMNALLMTSRGFAPVRTRR